VEPPPPQDVNKYQSSSSDCAFPLNDPLLDPQGLLLPLDTTWVQLAPWLGVGGKYTDYHPWMAGWSMLPGDGYGCNTGKRRRRRGKEALPSAAATMQQQQQLLLLLLLLLLNEW